MIRFALAAWIVAVSAWSCFAGENNSPLVITKSGYFLTSVNSAGVPTYTKLSTVIDLTGDGPTSPPEQPPVDKTIVDNSFAWAKAVNDPESAQAIAAVYAHIRGAVEDGTLDRVSVWPPLKQATDSALALIAGKDWTEFRDKLTDVFSEAQQRGELETPQQIARMLLSVQHGVELSADGSTAISFDRLVEIARRTNLAIDGVTK